MDRSPDKRIQTNFCSSKGTKNATQRKLLEKQGKWKDLPESNFLSFYENLNEKNLMNVKDVAQS